MQRPTPHTIHVLAATGIVLLALIGIFVWFQPSDDVRRTPLLADAPVAANPVSGTISRVYATAQVADAIDAVSAVTIARELIAAHADMLRGTAQSRELFEFVDGSPHQLVLWKQTIHPAIGTDPESYTLLFRQVESGVPLQGTTVKVHLTSTGQLRTLGADVFPDFAMDVTPKITKSQAIATMRTLRKLPQTDALDPELAVRTPMERGGAFLLAWIAAAPQEGDAGKYFRDELVVNAHTGEMSSRPLVRSTRWIPQAQAQTVPGVRARIPLDRPTDTPSELPLPGVDVTVDGTTVQTGADGSIPRTGSSYTTSLTSPTIETYEDSECPDDIDSCTSRSTLSGSTPSLVWTPQSNPTQPAYIGSLVNFHALVAEKAAIERWGFMKMQSSQIYNIVRVGFKDAQCNAFWSPLTGSGPDPSIIVIGLATSGCPMFNNLDTYADVAYHEYAHAVFYHEYDIFSYPQSKEGGAISEGWGDFIACVMTGNTNLDPLSSFGRVCNTTNTYQQLNALCGQDPACHDGGPVFSTALYGALTTSGVDKDTFMRAVFTGMAQQPTTFKGFGDAVLAAATDTAVQNALRTSFAARGITLTGSSGGGGGGGGATAQCGDGVITNPEVCDGSNFGSKTCATETSNARPGGTLSCQSNCTQISSSLCTTGGTSTGELGPGTGGTGGQAPGQFTIPTTNGRSYVVYVPTSYNPSTPARFVMLLVGQGGTAESTISKWKRHADADNVILASMTPKGDQGGYTAEADFSTIFTALNDIPTKYNIAANYYSLWGYSAGGHLAYTIGLDGDEGQRYADIFNALAIQAGNLNYAKQQGVYPTAPSDRRIPINVRVGSNDSMSSTVQADVTSLEANDYPVTSTVINGQGHEYTQADADAAWAFLKGINKAGNALAPCATNGCPTMGITQCASATSTKVCEQKTSGTTTCLGWSNPTNCTGSDTCSSPSATSAVCAPSGSSTLPSSDTSSVPSSDTSTPPPSSTVPTCGNEQREGDELCDGLDLGSNTCGTLGFAGGTLICHPGCNGFDVTACTPGSSATCGDGTVTLPEQCDDRNTMGGDGCSATCAIERTGPTVVKAVIPTPLVTQPAGSASVFDCRQSLGYNLACGWDYGDDTNSTGMADYTGNGVVDLLDLRFFVDAVYEASGDTAPAGTRFDLNNDGLTDAKDVQQIIQISTTHVTAHTYQTAGTYTVTLTVSGHDSIADVVTSTATRTVNVKRGSASGTFVASAGPDLSGNAGEAVTLLGSVQGGRSPFQISWKRDNGTADGISIPSSLLSGFTIPVGAATGTSYSFVLEVRDANGKTARDTMAVFVGVDGGGGTDSACVLPEGKRMAVLQLNTAGYAGAAKVKVYAPESVADAQNLDSIESVAQDFIDESFTDASIDPERRFFAGTGWGATAALIGGLAQSTDAAGIIHVDQESVRTCTTNSTDCTEVQSAIAELIAQAPRKIPIAITYKAGRTDRGAGTAAALRAAGYEDDVNLFILETTGAEPSSADLAQIIAWMESHPSTDACPTPTALGRADGTEDPRSLLSLLLGAEIARADGPTIETSYEEGAFAEPSDARGAALASRFSMSAAAQAASYLTALLAGVSFVLAIVGVAESVIAGRKKLPGRAARAKQLLVYALVGLVVLGGIFLSILVWIA